MTGEYIMNAIGCADEKYVCEMLKFRSVRNFKKFFTAAACLCIVLISAGILILNSWGTGRSGDLVTVGTVSGGAYDGSLVYFDDSGHLCMYTPGAGSELLVKNADSTYMSGSSIYYTLKNKVYVYDLTNRESTHLYTVDLRGSRLTSLQFISSECSGGRLSLILYTHTGFAHWLPGKLKFTPDEFQRKITLDTEGRLISDELYDGYSRGNYGSDISSSIKYSAQSYDFFKSEIKMTSPSGKVHWWTDFIRGGDSILDSPLYELYYWQICQDNIFITYINQGDETNTYPMVIHALIYCGNTGEIIYLDDMAYYFICGNNDFVFYTVELENGSGTAEYDLYCYDMSIREDYLIEQNFDAYQGIITGQYMYVSVPWNGGKTSCYRIVTEDGKVTGLTLIDENI